MSTVIKAGTIVTSDLTYKSDVLVENGKISSIGKNISGDKVIDASGCYIMPGGTAMVVDFLLAFTRSIH